MKRAAIMGILLTLAAFIIPIPAVSYRGEAENIPAEPEILQKEPVPEPEPEPEPVQTTYPDKNRVIRLKTDAGVETLSLRDYLIGVVSAEMPVSFCPEALKAQAVTARTYTLFRVERGAAHEDADVCADFNHCSAYLTDRELQQRWGEDYANNLEKIARAVDETDSLVVEYQGELIDAVFHSTSSGKTEAAVDVWGSDRPYLQSVDSSGDSISARYYGSREFTVAELKQLLQSALPDADLSGAAATWFTNVVRSQAGGVKTLTVGGVSTTGGVLRGALGLSSTNFDVTPLGDTMVFTTVGYGHGVGMSQYGAEAMARNGADFITILTHYYTDTAVTAYDGQAV